MTHAVDLFVMIELIETVKEILNKIKRMLRQKFGDDDNDWEFDGVMRPRTKQSLEECGALHQRAWMYVKWDSKRRYS